MNILKLLHRLRLSRHYQIVLTAVSILSFLCNSPKPTYAQSAELGVLAAAQRRAASQRTLNNDVLNEFRTLARIRLAATVGNVGDDGAVPDWLALLIRWLQTEIGRYVSGPCAMSLQQLAAAVTTSSNITTWALKFVDASGKLGSGILDGNLQLLGSFDECLEISDDAASPLHSRYCTTVVGHNTTSAGSSPEMTYAPQGIAVGTCLPAQCTQADVEAITNALLRETADRSAKLANISVLKSQCNSNDDVVEYSGPAIVAFVILGLFGSLLIIGTLLDAALQNHLASDRRRRQMIAANLVSRRSAELVQREPKNEQQQEEYGFLVRTLLCWSALRNGRKILTIESSKSARSGDAAPPLHSIHGIRFVSMCWVIYTHGFAFSIANLRDPVHFVNDVGRWYFQPLANASFSVDTFFFISGLLLAYVVTAQESVHSRINWVQYYVHRYWRLTPPYMLTLAVFAGLIKYMGMGPFWNPNSFFPQQCAYSWWSNLLYVNNFFELNSGCMAWSWYLANDMQFYVISPLFIVPFFYRRSLGIIAWAVLMLAFFAATISVTVVYKLPASFVAAIRQFDNAGLFWTYFTVYYVKPWTRIGPYLVGVAFGYLLFQAKRKNWRMPAGMSVVGMPIALAASAAIIFSLVNENAGTSNLSFVEASLYNILSRPAWGIIVGFVIVACKTGGGGFINTFFSFPGFIPLSRLSYCAYLVHPALQQLTYGRLTAQIGYSKLTLSIVSFGFIFAGFCLAFLVSLLFESPALALEKLATSALSGRKRRNDETTATLTRHRLQAAAAEDARALSRGSESINASSQQLATAAVM